MESTAQLDCQACGETIEIPVDSSGGRHQEFVEDCPVCCRPNVIRLHIDRDGELAIQAELEQF